MTLKYKKIKRKTWDFNKEMPKCPDKGAFEISYDDGSTYFIVDGERHRVDGPAVIWPNRTQFYYQKGKLHRVGGPAIIYPNGTQIYYQFGELHRTDGPAEIWANGPQYYYLFNREYTKKNWELRATKLRLKEQIL